MSQVDRSEGLVGNTAIKAAVRACAAANITLTGEQTIDGIACVTDDRVLLTGQTSALENGIWVVDTGSWVRGQDWDGVYDIAKGTLIQVTDGTSFANTLWKVTTTAPSIGSSVAISQFTGLAVDSSMMDFLQSGTGAVLQSVQQKERQIVNLMDFVSNAKRTTIIAHTLTDVTTELQAAIDAVSPTYAVNAMAGIVWLPPGAKLETTTRINATNSRVAATLCRDHLRLAGSGTMIVGSTGSGNSVIETTGSQWLTIDRGITIDTTLSGNPSTIGVLQACSSVLSQTQNQLICCRITMHSAPAANAGFGTVGIWNFGSEETTYGELYTQADCGHILTAHNDGTLTSTSVTTGAFAIGTQYQITNVGDTDFTLIGAASNTLGVIFTATGAGGGTTGTANSFLFSTYQSPLLTTHTCGVNHFRGECALINVSKTSPGLVIQNIASLSADNLFIGKNAGAAGACIYGLQFTGNISASTLNVHIEGFSSVLCKGSVITSTLRLVVGGVDAGLETYPAVVMHREQANGLIASTFIIDRQSLNGIASPGAHILGTVDNAGAFGESAAADPSSYYIAGSTFYARALGAAHLYVPPNVAANTGTRDNLLIGGVYTPSTPTFAVGILGDTALDKTGDGTQYTLNNENWLVEINRGGAFTPLTSTSAGGEFIAPLNADYSFNAKVALVGLTTAHNDIRIDILTTTSTANYMLAHCNPNGALIGLGSTAQEYDIQGQVSIPMVAGGYARLAVTVAGTTSKGIGILRGTSDVSYRTRWEGAAIKTN